MTIDAALWIQRSTPAAAAAAAAAAAERRDTGMKTAATNCSALKEIYRVTVSVRWTPKLGKSTVLSD